MDYISCFSFDGYFLNFLSWIWEISYYLFLDLYKSIRHDKFWCFNDFFIVCLRIQFIGFIHFIIEKIKIELIQGSLFVCITFII
jgi:hypothetical protein